MKIHISTSALTGRIYAGRLNKKGNAFLDGKEEVTSDVLRAVIEKSKYHGGSFDIQAGDDKWEVTVTKATEPSKEGK